MKSRMRESRMSGLIYKRIIKSDRVEREKKKATSEGGRSLLVKLFYKIVNVC